MSPDINIELSRAGQDAEGDSGYSDTDTKHQNNSREPRGPAATRHEDTHMVQYSTVSSSITHWLDEEEVCACV